MFPNLDLQGKSSTQFHSGEKKNKNHKRKKASYMEMRNSAGQVKMIFLKGNALPTAEV